MDIENANCKIKVSECSDMEVIPIERPIKIDQEITGLEKLIEQLHKVFSHDYVNVQDVQKLMSGYISNPRDWRKYAKFDRFRYTRNLVDSGNGAFNIMILCWGPGHASAIHDHADSHCFMKVLSGSLEEVRYEWPEKLQPKIIQKLKDNNNVRKSCCSIRDNELKTMGNLECHRDSCAEDQRKMGHVSKNGDYREGYDSRSMEEIGRTQLEVNDVCYINDALGLHRMENTSHVDGAVSLHLYSPPFDTCRVFDARTGKPSKVHVTFWSVHGKKIKRVIEAN